MIAAVQRAALLMRAGGASEYVVTKEERGEEGRDKVDGLSASGG
jgi:hypothetical protein